MHLVNLLFIQISTERKQIFFNRLGIYFCLIMNPNISSFQ